MRFVQPLLSLGGVFFGTLGSLCGLYLTTTHPPEPLACGVWVLTLLSAALSAWHGAHLGYEVCELAFGKPE